MSNATLSSFRTVAVATSPDRAKIIDVILAAFESDPVARWMLPADAAYRSVFKPLIAALGGGAFDHHSVYHTPDFSGAALWLPPGVDPDEAAIGTLVEHTLEGAARETMFSIFEQMGRAHPSGPHWYLPFIGVVPGYQGHGIGTALLEASLVQCDREGLPAYLESTNPRNVPLYERFGFRVSGEIQAGDCPALMPMIRPRRL
jgi:GNAT superfamily N-acetyltransferase